MTRYQVFKLKTKDTIAIILVISILASTLIFLPQQGVFAATVFTDDYETGTFSNWSGTEIWSPSSMQITSNTSIVFAGNYSADCALDGTNGTYAFAYTNLTSPLPTTIYHREYIRVSDLPPAGTETDLFGIMDVIGSGHHLGTIGIRSDSSNYLWRVKYYNGSDEIAYSSPANIKTDTWYYIEIMVKSGSGTGQVSVWIAEDLTNITQSSPTIDLPNLVNDANPIGAVFFGGYIFGTSYPAPTHIYSDSVIVSDSSRIGPRDFTAPAIGPITATSQSIGAPVTLSSSITDDFGIDYIIPSWNNTGTWVNQTAIDAQGSTNYTATLMGNWNNTPGTIVSARFYANDTSNNWAAGNQVDFALSNYGVTLSANQTGLTQEDTVNVTLSVMKNGLPFSNYLANVSKDGSLFLNNRTASFTDMDLHAVTHAYNVSSLYDAVTGENVTFSTNTLNVVWAASVYGVTLSANQTGLTQEDTVNVTLSVMKNGLPFSNYLANVSKDGSLFLNNRTASFTDMDLHAVTHAYNVSSLYDAVTGENVTFSTNTLNVVWAASTYQVTLSASPSSLLRLNTVTISLSVMKNGLPFSNYLANVTKGGSLFQENAVASFQDTESAAVQRTYGVSSLYDVVTGELVTFTANTVSVTWTNPPVSSTPTPTPTPIATPTATPSSTATASPTPSTTATSSPTPEPTNEGLSAEALIGIAIVIAIIIVVIVVYLIIKKPKLGK